MAINPDVILVDRYVRGEWYINILYNIALGLVGSYIMELGGELPNPPR